MKYARTKVTARICLLLVAFLMAGGPVLGGGYEHTSNGPLGGVVQALAFGADGTYYAAVFQGWIFRSVNGGASWIRSKAGIANSARTISSLAAATTAVYAGSTTGGVLKTTNNGVSWTQMNTGLDNLHIASLLIDPVSPATLYAGTAGSGVYRYAGGSWAAMNAGALTANVLSLAATANGTLYLGRQYDAAYYGVYAWDGSAWQEANNGLPANATVQSLLASGNDLWAGTAGSGVYYWNGSTWTARNTGLPTGDARIVRSMGRSGDGDVYVGTSAGVYRWTGTAWETRSTGLEGSGLRVRAIASPSGSTLFAGTDGRGIYKSIDGGATWAETNSNLAGHVVRAVAINPQYDWRVYAGTFRGGVHRSVNGGESWSWWSQGLGDVEVEALAVSYPKGAPIYAGLNGQGVYRRDRVNDFNVWTDWQPKTDGLSGSGLSVHALAIKPDEPVVVFAGTEGGVYKTTSSGDSWSLSSSGLPYAVTALAIDPTTPSKIYAGTRLNGVYISTDTGVHWTPLSGLTGNSAKILSLSADSLGKIHAGTVDGVHMHDGVSWTSEGMEDTQIYAMTVNPITPTQLYIGTAEGSVAFGVMRKTPDGWEPLNTGLDNLNVYALSIDDYSPQTMHTGTGGSSVWDYTFGATPPAPAPEVGVNLDDGTTFVHLTEVMTYTITYYNTGIVDATGVVISITVPNFADYVRSDPPFIQVQPGVYWLQNLFAERETVYQASFTVRVRMNPPFPEMLTARAKIWDDGGSGPDPFLLNNTEDDVDVLQLGDLEIEVTKDAWPPADTNIAPGSKITYTIGYENVSWRPGTECVLTETYDLEGDYTFVSADPPPTHGNNEWNLGMIGLFEQDTIQVVVQLKDELPNNWPITNQVALKCLEAAAVPRPQVRHTVYVPPQQQMVDLAVEGIQWTPTSPRPNSPVRFSVRIANRGTARADVPFFLELYVKPVPSNAPEGPWDHDQGYCAGSCNRVEYLRHIAYLDPGVVYDQAFDGISLPAEGTYNVYAQIDMAFDALEYNPFWGRYAESTETNNIWGASINCGPVINKIYLPLIRRQS